jgi:hypothetical protein
MKTALNRTRAALAIVAVLFLAIGLQGDVPPVEDYIIVVDYSGSILFVGAGFQPPEPVDELDGSTVYGIGMGDFDGDGDYDFVVGDRMGGNLFYFEKLGPGNDFAERVLLGEYSGFPMDFAVEDFNNDGNYDFVFTNYMGIGYHYVGRGDGTFDLVEFGVPNKCLMADAGDFNGDGNKDFILQKFDRDTGIIYIFFGDGAGNFLNTVVETTIGSYSWGLAAGDFDGDGQDDIIVTARNTTTRIYFQHGFGDGTFGSPELLYDLGLSDYTPLDNFDFDYDGKMDFIFIAAQALQGHVLYGNGDGTFVEADELIYFPADDAIFGLSTPPCVLAPPNEPPVAEAGEAVSVEADGDGMGRVILDGSASSDPDGDELSYHWAIGDFESDGMVFEVDLPIGEYTALLTVSDGEVEDADTVEVEVVDVTLPSLELSVEPKWLWPPNHKMREVFVSFEASDNSGEPPLVELVGVTSSDPDDIQITDDGRIFLRAERNWKNREPRIYTITYKASDAAGNTVEASAEVIVPTPRMVIKKIIKELKKRLKQKRKELKEKIKAMKKAMKDKKKKKRK